MDSGKILKLLKLTSHIILENGGETYRAENTVDIICDSLGVADVSTFALPTGVFISISEDGTSFQTCVSRIKKRTINLAKIEETNSIVRDLTIGKIEIDEAIEMLVSLTVSTKKKKVLPVLAAGISSGFFALLFGGSLIDFIIAAICGGVVQFIAVSFKREAMFHFIISFIGGAIIAFIALVGTHIAGGGEIEKIIAGSMMPLLPGLAMTNAVSDTIYGNLVSGTARAAEAVLIALSLAAGAGIVLKLGFLLGVPT